MPDFPELLILRHGETEWNRQGRMQGALDSPLTDAGRQHARDQGRVLRRLGVTSHNWYCSPQGRARETARLASGDGPVTPDERLREIGMGDWSGRTRDEIAAVAPEYFSPDSPPLAYYGHAPGGETPAAVADRLRPFLETLAGPAVIVTHGVTSRLIRCLALGLPVSAFAALEGGQGIVYRVAPGVYQRLSLQGVEELELP